MELSRSNLDLITSITNGDFINRNNIPHQYELQFKIMELENEVSMITSKKSEDISSVKSLTQRVNMITQTRLMLYENIGCSEKLFVKNLLKSTTEIFKLNLTRKISHSIWILADGGVIDQAYHTKRLILAYIYYKALVDISNFGLTTNVLENLTSRIFKAASIGKAKSTVKKLAKFLLH